VELTQQAGLLHDVGLMALPENIRKKPVYEMSPQELDNYEQHPLLAEMALSAAPGLEQVAKVIKQHHERLDGSGFPEGLHAKDISRPARIVAVVADYHDLYHGLLQPHCVGHQDAKVYLQQQSGLAYEKLIVEHFLKLINPEDNPKVKRYRAFVYQLKAGMTLEEDLRADNKLLLLTQGTTITQSIIDRLYCYEIKFKCHFEILIKEAE
jgi:response regulator RpfG family c-di-GMP phosphodiesterase